MRKTWKKGMAAVMTAVMVSGALAGCGSGAGQKTETAAAETAQTGAAAEAAKDETTAAESSVAATEVAEETEILVAAAASLKNAYEEELIPMFEAQYPGVTVKSTYDSSGKLQTQIEEGLEADVFMSAATKQMKALDEEGMIASDTITDLLENKIVLIVPTGSDSKIDSFEKIGDAASIALGAPESVPAGQYAKEALTNLNVWDSIQDKVSFGTNVTEVLNQVAAASADAGIVYATDAQTENTNGDDKEVEIVATAEDSMMQIPVVYPVGVVSASTHKDEAKAFEDFLQTDEAKAILEKAGFTINK